jgi:DMSO/TMAO reductase YedYZ molybdopterin-dependent catalytic subunit
VKRLRSGWRFAFAGAVAVSAALATGELLAGLLPGVPSPLLAVARFIVDIQPPGAKELVVGLFGEADKVAFQVFIVIVALAVGAGLGLLARSRLEIATWVIALFVGAGFIASLRDPSVGAPLAAAAAAIQLVVGVMVLRRLAPLAAGAVPTGRDRGNAGADATAGMGGTAAARAIPLESASATTVRVRAGGPSPGSARRSADARSGMPDWSRRKLLQAGGAVAIGSVAAGTLGRFLLEKQRAPAIPGSVPAAPQPATLPAGADIATTDLTTAGLSPIVVPNASFYRIDTAFIPPAVDRDSWRLKVTGLVDRVVELTYSELVALPLVEQFVTIACVSNEVGGNLVGNARWTGVPLRTVLEMAGVQGSADQLVGKSVDGFTAGMPVEWVMDPSRLPMIAIAMNGEPLPRAHGYPARLIIPGLYGYVSATKWLTELQLTRFDQFEGFWVPLGWAAKAPILTQSRIDVPSSGARVKAGGVPVAGVAWAPDRGIQGVEVRIDDGDWAPARLSAPISKSTWVQWLYAWNATPGSHTIEVRATDGAGEVQTESHSPPAPDGARGHHRIQVTAG